MCFIDYKKAFDCVDHERMWIILKDMGVPIHLVVLLRNLYANQKATVRTEFGETEQIDIGKGVRQGCNPVSFVIQHIRREYNERCLGQMGGRGRHRRKGDNESEIRRRHNSNRRNKGGLDRNHGKSKENKRESRPISECFKD